MSQGRAGQRARGIEAIAAGVDDEDWILDAAAALLDRRRHQFPLPLDAPSATWLGDRDVESLLRGASKRAVDEFAEVVEAEGAAEEEGLTQNLLSLLANRLRAVNPTLRIAVPAGKAPNIDVERRTIPKSEENTIGADLGVIVNIEIPGRSRIRFGDLVQVKKSKQLRAPRSNANRADSWTIDTVQLRDLLTHSATAVYWLIAKNGNVHVVPAKMLLGLGSGRGKPGAGSFTARYQDIRHVAITLGNYLCDVLLGMWTGNANDNAVAIAAGRDRRTRPRQLFSITVRIIDQG